MTTAESVVMTVFHGLHHYKMNLCEKCSKQVGLISAQLLTCDNDNRLLITTMTWLSLNTAQHHVLSHQTN